MVNGLQRKYTLLVITWGHQSLEWSLPPFLISHFRDNPDIWTAVRKLQRFCLPQFMIDKMKTFMRSVQGKWGVHWPTVICTQIVCKFWSNVQVSVYLTVYCICFCSAEPLRLPVNMDNDITDCALIPLGSRTLSLSCTPHRCPKLWSNFWGMFPYVIVAHSTLPCFQVTFLLHGLLMEL